MASATSHHSRPPGDGLPPKGSLTSSLSEHLAKTRPPPPPAAMMHRAPSGGSAASDSSREGLRREIVRRRKSLTHSEFNFLQGIVANGTEVEVCLVQQKLNDPSLCFDVDDSFEEDTDNNSNSDGRRTSLGSSVHTPTDQPEGQAPGTPPRNDMIGQLLCPTLSEDQHTVSTFDPEASIDTCATGQGKPPSRPIPLSPHRDRGTLGIPSHAELYPDGHHNHFSIDLEQTPLVQNLRPPRSLEGAAPLPLSQGSNSSGMHHIMMEDHLVTPGTDNTTSALRPLHRRTSNPLVDQLWRAHEQGLVVTPQQAKQRIQLRREQSLSAVSPLRRYSTSSRASSKGMDNRALLNSQELRLIKQRHIRTQSQIEWLSHNHTNNHTLRYQQQRSSSQMDAMAMMTVLQNASTDSSLEHSQNDISSLLLPTDEEIFRRSLQAVHNKRPPPPRPFNKERISSDSNVVNKTAPLQRMRSEGAPPLVTRRPSALRRMTSDGSQRSKSVSFHIMQDQNDSASGNLKPPTKTNELDDSTSTFASDHPSSEQILKWGRRDSEFSLNLHKAHPIRQESIGSTASGWEAAQAFQQDLIGKPNVLNRKDSVNSVASLNLHHAHPIRQESIGSTAEGANANRSFQEELALAASLASSPTLSRDDRSSIVSRRDSVASLNLHHAHPIQKDCIDVLSDRDSVGSFTGDSALEAFRRQFSAGKGWGRRESLNSLASLDLHIAAPIIQDAIFQRQDSLDSTVVMEGEGGVDTSEAFRPAGWARRESMSSIASLDLHKAHFIGTRDSSNSLTSLKLERALPLRKDSIASVQGSNAVEAFRAEVASQSWGRRDSNASIASLNLHIAHPIRQESICSNAAGLDATESLRREFLVEPNTVLKPTWGRQSSMGSVASLILHKAHPIVSRNASASADIEALRNKGSAFNSSENDLFELSLNSIPPGQPLGLRQDSIASTGTGKEALKKEVVDGTGESLRSASPVTLGSSLRSIPSLHPGLPIAHRDSMTSIPSLHHGKPIRQDSIASTAAGLEAKEWLQKQVSHASIVASEWEGVVSPDEWEDKKMENEDATFGTARDDKHEHLVVKVQARDVPRPVFMRLASQNECDEEGMEVAAVDELAMELDQEHSPPLKLETQILVPDPPRGSFRRESGSMPKPGEAASPERRESEPSCETKQRQDTYRHFPNSLVSFGEASTSLRSSAHTVELSASFDESKSIERYRGVFRGQLPRSLSEDELSALLMAGNCKPKLARGESDATVYPENLNSSSWELDTVVGDFDAWDAIKDDYINGYGGGGTLPFQILGTSARDVDSRPHVMSPPLMESLQSFFPISKSQDNFWLKYSIVRDGASLHTFMQRARGARYSLLALETVDGEVFGAFTTEPWRKTWNYFGSGESFLWRMRNSRKTQCYSIIDQAAMETEIDVYPYTGANQNIQLCTHSTIAVGGGTPEHTEAEEKRDDNDNHQSSAHEKSAEFKDYEWGYGLALQADLQHGSSSPCLTFGSPSLSKTHSDGSLFEIVNVELWGLTPCTNLMDAEKLELGRLFLEPSFQQPHF